MFVTCGKSNDRYPFGWKIDRKWSGDFNLSFKSICAFWQSIFSKQIHLQQFRQTHSYINNENRFVKLSLRFSNYKELRVSHFCVSPKVHFRLRLIGIVFKFENESDRVAMKEGLCVLDFIEKAVQIGLGSQWLSRGRVCLMSACAALNYLLLSSERAGWIKLLVLPHSLKSRST